MKRNVALVDSDTAVLATAKNYFFSDNEINLCVFKSFSELNASPFDIIVFNIELCLLEPIPTAKSHSGILIATCSASSSDIIERYSCLGINNVFNKPLDFTALRKIIINPKLIRTPTCPVNNIDNVISQIFLHSGISPHVSGYRFLREAIKLAICFPEMINQLTKRLYPSVAKKFNTSASRVERSIRTAIDIAWNKGKIESINSLFSIRVFGKNDKPTNGELVAFLADRLINESDILYSH